ncbi:hypothetical protein WDU94_001118 [Cyamophila willieti]
MKFTVTGKHVSQMGRLGILSEFSRIPEAQFETPTFMLYARGGVVTHLTYETLQQVNTDSCILQIPFPSISIMKDAVQQSNQQFLSNFIGMKEYPSYVCLHDPLNLALQKNKRKMEVALKGRRGNENHTVEKFISSIESLAPDMYQVLTQLEFTNKPKRNQIILGRSIQFLDNCLSLHKKSEVLKNTSVIAAIQGGSDLSLRKECAVQCASRDVHGFLIDGLCPEEDTTEDVDSDFVKAVLENTVPHLPPDKYRLVQGSWSPMNIVTFIHHGIDLFDSSLPLTLAERGCAFTFQYVKHSQENSSPNHVSFTNGIHAHHTNGVDSDKHSIDQAELILSDSSDTKVKSNGKSDGDTLYTPRPYEMWLQHPRYESDFTPVLSQCECYTCRNHTRAYIHHLISVKEMLASVLLSIHNLHHYFKFFKTIRESLLSGDSNSYTFHFRDSEDR